MDFLLYSLCKHGNFSIAYLLNSSYNVGKETAYSMNWSASIRIRLLVLQRIVRNGEAHISD